jgi:ABC-type branched-subunit amino acid transport system substrate-binding protein
LADVLTIDQEVLDLVVQAGPAGGDKLTKMADSLGFDQQDFQPILNKMLEQIDTLKADAIILYVNPIAFPVIYKGLRGLSVTLPILAGAACAHPAIFAQGPEAVEGAYIMDSGGNVNPAAMPDSWPSKALQIEFAERYQAKYNTVPDFFSAVGADGVTALVAAMKQAGELDQAMVAQALINLKDLPTLQGPMNFSPTNTATGIFGGFVEWTVKGGQFTDPKIIN